MKYKASLYLIQPLTNLHAGSGDTTYGIVDREVQRDPVTGYPVIHSSSLKGALRELFAHHLNGNGSGNGHAHETVETVFGRYIKNQKENNVPFSGKYVFFEAKLLALPVRSNKRPFFLAVSPCTLTDFFDTLTAFGIEAGELQVKFEAVRNSSLFGSLSKPLVRGDTDTHELIVEDFEDFQVNDNNDWKEFLKTMHEKKLLGEHVILFGDAHFAQLCQQLPVIARNNLENGISTNLWYEEVVPRFSRFYTVILGPDGDTTFEDNFPENRIVQIGGNATVGYGQCKFQRVSLVEN